MTFFRPKPKVLTVAELYSLRPAPLHTCEELLLVASLIPTLIVVIFTHHSPSSLTLFLCPHPQSCWKLVFFQCFFLFFTTNSLWCVLVFTIYFFLLGERILGNVRSLEACFIVARFVHLNIVVCFYCTTKFSFVFYCLSFFNFFVFVPFLVVFSILLSMQVEIF